MEGESGRPSEKFARPAAPGADLPDRHQFLRFGIGQRLEQHAVHDAEDGRVGADADGSVSNATAVNIGLWRSVRSP